MVALATNLPAISTFEHVLEGRGVQNPFAPPQQSIGVGTADTRTTGFVQRTETKFKEPQQ